MARKRTYAETQKVEKFWLSNKEAIAYTGTTTQFLERMRRDGELPYSKIGGKYIFYKVSDVDKMIERHRVY